MVEVIECDIHRMLPAEMIGDSDRILDSPIRLGVHLSEASDCRVVVLGR
ncbi:hypothetical protein C497_03780 [Halalkalicoccus jeotgali B3]|uniref:Uncharacterized protein n=1 Tax=Halalkalicoccus jeotgali (strain DSM 18796 / CECT 7217 / JCM 14584 / KCTC 4019 / B3) TaxID=795797 RepID=D8J9V0_HALJB|nr:hypothetical protein HacjB3_05405 [Halalkalicoccus jeotgali B3]ELY40186.1 hypothetical protein C497_03780 [Halalkalicoccus jeotgali B3]